MSSSSVEISQSAFPNACIDLPDRQLFVFLLFFVSGGITSLNDVIIPKRKELLMLTYAQAMLAKV